MANLGVYAPDSTAATPEIHQFYSHVGGVRQREKLLFARGGAGVPIFYLMPVGFERKG